MRDRILKLFLWTLLIFLTACAGGQVSSEQKRSPKQPTIKLKLHRLSMEITRPDDAYFSRVKGSRKLYVQANTPYTTVYQYDLRDLGAKPRAKRKRGPRYRKLLSGSQRGSYYLHGLLWQPGHKKDYPLLISNQNENESGIRIKKLFVSKKRKSFARDVDPNPQNEKYNSVRTGDFNGDGYQDILAGYNTVNVVPGKTKGTQHDITFYLYLGNQRGQYRFKQKLEVKDFHPSGRTIADFDGDGRDDLIAVDVCTLKHTFTILCSDKARKAKPRVYVISFVNGRLKLSRKIRFKEKNIDHTPLLFVDMNKDRRLDIVIGYRDKSRESQGGHVNECCFVYLNRGPNKSFRKKTINMLDSLMFGNHPDLDGDGEAEFFTYDSKSYELWSIENEQFKKRRLRLIWDDHKPIVLGSVYDHYDFDGDGDEDLIFMSGTTITKIRKNAAGEIVKKTVTSPIYLAENLTKQVKKKRKQKRKQKRKNKK